MDIISYQKAKKAQKEIKNTQDQLGYGGTEQGLDIRDIYNSTHERLKELEKKNPGDVLNKRVSDMEANTHVNLNKHNLYVNSILQQDKYNMKELVFDDFADDSGIDSSLSSGYVHDEEGRMVKIAEGESQAEIVTIAEETETPPQHVAVSIASNEQLTGERILDFTKGTHQGTIGESLTGELGVEWDSVKDQVVWIYTEGSGTKLSLLQEEDGTYPRVGVWESDILSFGQVKSLYRLNLQTSDSDKVKIYTSTSVDGKVFSNYLTLNTDGTIGSPHGNYLKIKVELYADGDAKERIIYGFEEEKRNAFQENEHIVFEGSARLKTDYTLESQVVDSWTEEGTLLSFTLDKKRFKTFEKIMVKK